MALIDEIRSIERKSFNNRFNEWYEQEDLESKIKSSAMKGYKGYKINILNSEKRKELSLLFSHPGFKNRLEGMLGDGFEVEYIKKKSPYKHKFLDITMYQQEDYLIIGWK